MKSTYENTLGSERTVELEFLLTELSNLKSISVLDVGGIPTDSTQTVLIDKVCKYNDINYKICDFRGGDYKGDFVTIEIRERFDCIIFLSSLEHFPQCTEGDLKYREGEDIKGFKKALSLLKENGIILLTVPFGKHIWQNYHQNYNINGIKQLTEGSIILEQYIYTLKDNMWELTPENLTMEIRYTDRCFCVGLFKLKKI